MKVWRNEYDWVAAETAEEAAAFFEGLTGCEPSESGPWEEEADLSKKIIYEDEENPADRESTLAAELEAGMKIHGGKPFYLCGVEP